MSDIINWRAPAFLSALLLAATPLHAQFIKGTVRDSETRAPVRSGFVVLLDSTAGVVIGTAVDSRGRYTIAVPEGGVYAVATSGTGYVTNISTWIAMVATDSFEVDVKLARAVNTLAPMVIEAQRDSLRNIGIPGLMSRIVAGTIVTPAEVAIAAQTAVSPYDVLQTLNIATLELKTMYLDGERQGERHIHGGMYRCIAYRRTGGCVTVVVNGQRYSSRSDLVELDGLFGATDISYMVFLRPSEAGLLYGEETTNGVLVIVRKGQH
ncbi:MAG: carboxypeptidase regulatory-like domain-containing protein [Gemmatimonadaceae bacterium]|nr:carboxypeptidase regulatory-like domain-containing protein [Gemmatimonadaceae bacterium]